MYFFGLLEGSHLVQHVSIIPGHVPWLSQSTFLPENMQENMFRHVPSHPDRCLKFCWFWCCFLYFLRCRFLFLSWYRIRWRLYGAVKKIRKFRWLQNCFGTLQEFWSEFCLKTPLDISKLWNSYWIFVRWIWNSWRISIRILVENIVTNPSDDSGIFNRILIRILVGNAALENYRQLRNS